MCPDWSTFGIKASPIRPLAGKYHPSKSAIRPIRGLMRRLTLATQPDILNRFSLHPTFKEK